MKRIAILGSTGSIGTQTLDVVRANGDIEVVGIAAGRNIDALESQIREFSPKICGVWDEEKAKELAVRVADTGTKIVSGMEGLLEIAVMEGYEILVTAVVGMIGIRRRWQLLRQERTLPWQTRRLLSLRGISSSHS